MNYRSKDDARILRMRTLRSALMSCGMLGMLTVVSCSDSPSLKVIVNHGASSFVLTETRVDVYESATLTCDKLRFGKVTLESIAPFRITDQNTTDDLQGLPRTGHIVVVAKGYVGETIAMIGCNEVDEIKQGDTLVITTKPATLVSAQATTEKNGDVTIKVTITDIANQSIEDIPVHWTLYGPDKATFAQGKLADVTSDDEPGVYLIDEHAACPSAECSGGLGRVTKRIAHPSLSGPFAVRPRVEWALTPSAPLTQFAGELLEIDTSINLGDFNGVRRIVNPCTVFRPVGQAASLFCLHSQANSKIGIAQYSFSAGSISQTVRQVDAFSTTIQNPMNFPVAILSDAENVFVLSLHGNWKKVFSTTLPLPSPTNETTAWPLMDGQIVSQAVFLPACGTTPARVAALARPPLMPTAPFTAVSSSLGSAQLVPIVANGAELPANIVLQNGGCATNVGIDPPVVYQSIVGTALPSTDGLAVGAYMTFAPGAGLFESVFSISRVPAAGYAVSVGAAGDQRILTAEVDITGAVIQESVLSTKTGNGGNNTPALLIRRTFPAISLPTQIRSGNFDSGAEIDLAWMIQQERTSLMQVLLDRPVGGDRLSAFYTQEFAGTFDTGNFDNMGATDIISWGVGETNDGSTTRVFRVSVATMGVAL